MRNACWEGVWADGVRTYWTISSLFPKKIHTHCTNKWTSLPSTGCLFFFNKVFLILKIDHHTFGGFFLILNSAASGMVWTSWRDMHGLAFALLQAERANIFQVKHVALSRSSFAKSSTWPHLTSTFIFSAAVGFFFGFFSPLTPAILPPCASSPTESLPFKHKQ